MLIGLCRRGKIASYNNDGTMNVQLDDSNQIDSESSIVSVPIPVSYSGNNGELIAGYPEIDTPVSVEYGQGEWFVNSYLPATNVFDPNSNVLNPIDYTAEFKTGRLLLQTANARNRIFLDPNDGISIGDISQNYTINNIRNISADTVNNKLKFSSASRKIEGLIKRDLGDSSVRTIEGSTLTSIDYDDALYTVGMDKSSDLSFITANGLARNLPLTENREIVYEMDYSPSSSYSFESDEKESSKYDSKNRSLRAPYNKNQNRATTFSLSLHDPNLLIEEIKGTGVDSLANIIDINRTILPIGTEDQSTFKLNSDDVDAFKKIRALHRKSLAYHFEINARKSNKDDIFYVPNSTDYADHARVRSTFFMDVDKEGQFKINVPASSETGNIPLLTRYTTASTLAYDNKKVSNPNKFLTLSEREEYFKESPEQDIYLESIQNFDGVKLVNDSGEVAPHDRKNDKPLTLNMMYHDVKAANYQFLQSTADDYPEDYNLYLWMDNLNLNDRAKPTSENPIQYEKIVSEEINVSGDNANAGGRSGTINLDGFLHMNIGANTVDRQSLWLDTAGGIVGMIGRDKRGISLATTLDGDFIMELDATTPTANNDSRFNGPNGENNAQRFPSFDIRIMTEFGLATLRIDSKGLTIAHPGRMELASSGNMTLRSNSDIIMFAEHVRFYGEDNEGTMRTVKRNGVPEI